jgi:monoamine oxidase
MAGEASELSEMVNEDAVVHKVMGVLRKMFGVSKVPSMPSASVVTRWGSDPFARSAYSYVSTGCTGHDYDILAEPVAKTLFFAGEHTNRKHPTTVAGAMLSGWREAGKIASIHGRWRTNIVEDLMKLDSVWDKKVDDHENDESEEDENEE